MLVFEWDEAKDAANVQKHGIGFEAASSALEDPACIVEENLEIGGEQRLGAIGVTATGMILHVTFLEDSDERDIYARIISARKATPQERTRYGQNRKTNTRYTP